MKAYLKSNPKQVNWENVNIGDIGYRLVQKDQKQYMGEQVAQVEDAPGAARNSTSTSA